jgi:type 1 fimbria pilin
VRFQVVSDSVSTPATDGSQTIHVQSDDYAIADLTVGKQFSFPLPSGDSNAPNDTGYERYIGVQAVVGTAALTAGAINAFLTFEPSIWKSYPDAQN